MPDPRTPDPVACKHERTQLIARDDNSTYVECLDCGEILKQMAKELKNEARLRRIARRVSDASLIRLAYCLSRTVSVIDTLLNKTLVILSEARDLLLLFLRRHARRPRQEIRSFSYQPRYVSGRNVVERVLVFLLQPLPQDIPRRCSSPRGPKDSGLCARETTRTPGAPARASRPCHRR